ncbi:MAG: TetR/AcrR family transcriptional regulator [Pseudomonadales bacterium]|nr:TetR/AcrR family transcriptional regulator [Pseudomonadales bacterium]
MSKKHYHHGNLAEDILNRAVQIIDEGGLGALTLRGIARDLGVSHGAPNRHFKNKAALLSTLATYGWHKVLEATLRADNVDSLDPRLSLNAMGRGFLRWALHNPALFRTLHHPDVARFADDALIEAMRQFTQAISDAVAATQTIGNHPGVPLEILSIYINAVPFGAAMFLIDPFLTHYEQSEIQDMDEEILIEQLINLVVPLK